MPTDYWLLSFNYHIYFKRCFEDDTDPYKDEAVELLNERDAEGKSPLDLAACLGRIEITKQLIERGADVCNSTAKGTSVVYLYCV